MKYPLFKPGEVVRVTNSTYFSSSSHRTLADMRGEVIIHRRYRDHTNNGEPYYYVQAAAFGNREYMFAAKDLERIKDEVSSI